MMSELHKCRPIGEKAMREIVREEIAKTDANHVATLEKAWVEVDRLIVRGELPGNGWDRTAERNGIIIAANKLREMIDRATAGKGEGL
jgi:hypothetical protein